MYWYLKVWKQYADFSGRARRQEYWMFFLFNSIFAAVLYLLGGLWSGFSVLYILYTLAVFIPGLAVLVRRLHDIGKSGGWFFIVFVPIIGFIWLLVLLVTEGNADDNQYGKDPKQL
jgi:uncharacterized membrane protein YhaH (DUF805 family)